MRGVRVAEYHLKRERLKGEKELGMKIDGRG